MLRYRLVLLIYITFSSLRSRLKAGLATPLNVGWSLAKRALLVQQI